MSKVKEYFYDIEEIISDEMNCDDYILTRPDFNVIDFLINNRERILDFYKKYDEFKEEN